MSLPPPDSTFSRRTLVVLMEDKPGVLSHVSNLFRRRNYIIESLTWAQRGPGHLADTWCYANTPARAGGQQLTVINVTR